MFEAVFKSVQQMGSFSEDDLTLIADKLRTQQLTKDTFLLKPGEVCRSFYFLNSGAVRQYKMNDELEELTLNLYTQDNWLSDHTSFTLQKPSENFIQAFEDSEVVELDIHSVHSLIAQYPVFFQLGKLLEIVRQESEQYNRLKSPEEKYREVMKNNPKLIQKFPLKYIASYLKMTPETLSRVRSKIQSYSRKS